FQDLDALRVIEIAKDLDVIAETVDVEVRARVHAADDKLVAIAFALMHGDAGYVARDVSETLEALVTDEALGHHVERLRNIDQRRVALGRDRSAVGIDADRAGARVLAVGGRRWRGLRARRPRRGGVAALGHPGAAHQPRAARRAARGVHVDWR